MPPCTARKMGFVKTAGVVSSACVFSFQVLDLYEAMFIAGFCEKQIGRDVRGGRDVCPGLREPAPSDSR